MASVKVTQDDLRKIMKEKRENPKNRIDSPFAKYNSLGQLSCTICNIQIKSNALWTAHVAGKIHKENALKKRKRTADIPPNNVLHNNVKKSEEQEPVFKKPKIYTKESPSPKEEPVKSMGKLTLLETYSSSSEDEDGEAPAEPVANASIADNVLPKDFFDSAPTPFIINKDQNPNGDKKTAAESANSVEALPEGFFDDPVLDAKARNIEYKDPVEEEWEKYQKAIAEETNVSKTIIEEDLEESTLERDLTEIDLQINLWGKSKTLQTTAEEARLVTPSNADKKDSSGNTDDELEEDDLLDWRSKGIKKR